MKTLHTLFLTGAVITLTACHGIFDDLYDQVDDTSKDSTEINTGTDSTVVISGTLHIDASSWTDWYYIDLKAMADSAAVGRTSFTSPIPYPIPLEPTEATESTTPGEGKWGIYTYWYDVWGKGISVNEYRSYMATERQPEPEQWTFAVHRNNVRTNGGAVHETSLTDISQLHFSHEELSRLTCTPDEWSENTVWTIQAQMLNCLIGSQGIAINNVLSSWLHVDLPPIPPAFTHNHHVFILRLEDGTHAALQLEDYQSSTGTKCVLTINYKYPL